jgi:hypothetical protein
MALPRETGLKRIYGDGKKNGCGGEYEEIDSGTRSKSNGRSRKVQKG